MDKNRNNRNNRNKSKEDLSYWDESVHTSLSYWFCAIAVGIQLVLGLRNITTTFGQLCIVEFLFGTAGLLFLDPLHGKKWIYPKKFKKWQSDTFYRFAITFGVIAAIQFLFQIIPLITSTEFALAVVFCSVVEEYFFRGILNEPFFRATHKMGDRVAKFTVWSYKDKPKKEMSYIELGGIILSGSLFAAFHVNYYGQLNLILMVFVGGLWLGFVYWFNKDLTAVILAHFMLNIIFIFQFYQTIGL